MTESIAPWTFQDLRAAALEAIECMHESGMSKDEYLEWMTAEAICESPGNAARAKAVAATVRNMLIVRKEDR